MNNRYRSFFWPAALILAGLIALLVNTGAISADRLALLFYLWPVILIVIGLELIVRRSLHGTAGDVAAVLILVLALVGAVGYVVASPNPSATHTSDSSGAIGNNEHAAAAIDVGAATVTISGSSDLGSDLYRAHFEYSGPAPTVEFDAKNGTLRISQQDSSFFQRRNLAITLQLNPSVPWTLTQSSGASTDVINVASLRVSEIALSTGAGRAEITLGPPTGIVPVKIDGGALTVNLHRPAGAAASVTVSGGAVSLDFDGRHTSAVGTVESTTSTSPDMYRIDVSGGACRVTMDAAAASG